MKIIPLFPLQIVLFPGEKLPLHIFEPRYKEMIRHCVANDEPFGLVSFIKNKVSRIGCLATVDAISKQYEDGKADIICTGHDRFITHSFDSSKAYLQGHITKFHDSGETTDADKQFLKRILPSFKKLVEIAEFKTGILSDEVPHDSFGFAHLVGFDLSQKQNLLEIKTERERLVYIKMHIDRTLPKIKAFEEVRERISRNGHFRKFPPIDFKTE